MVYDISIDLFIACFFVAYLIKESSASDESFKFTASTPQVAFPALKSLRISGLPNMTDIWDKKICPAQSFCSLKFLSVYFCCELVNVVPSNMLPKLRNLETLWLDQCPMVEVVVDLEKKEEETQEATNNTIVLFPKLRDMSLKGLPNIKDFWAFRSEEQRVFNAEVAFPKLDYPSTSFNHLVTVCVTDCMLKYLFSPSSLRGLVRLQKLEIARCTVMEGVIGIEGEKDEDFMINFSRLVDLKLEDLPNLLGFYPQKEKTTTNSGSSSTRAQTVLFTDKVAFPALERLHISDFPHITDIWDKKICPAQSFCSLKYLYVHGCGKLVNVVPSNMLPKLRNLETFKLTRCPMVEVVVDLEKKEEETQEATNNTIVPFPELRSMSLKALPNIKNFGAFRSEEQHVFNAQVSFPKLNTLCVGPSGERVLWPLMGASELSLNELELSTDVDELVSLNELELSTVVSPHLFRSLRLVKKLTVIRYHGAREVFHFDEQEVGEGQVRIGPHQATCLWNKDPHRLLVLQSLERLEISNCPLLANLLTVSVAKALGGLKELILGSCSTIEEVISMDEGHANAIDDDEIEFPKLELLMLTRLSNLKSFCSSNHNLKFPSLKRVLLKKCPKLQAFTSRSVHMSLILYTYRRNNYLVIEDLNKFLQQQHLEGEETILEDGICDELSDAIYGGNVRTLEIMSDFHSGDEQQLSKKRKRNSDEEV